MKKHAPGSQNIIRLALAIALSPVLSLHGRAQDNEELSKYPLPKIPACELSKGRFLIFQSVADEDHATFNGHRILHKESRSAVWSLGIADTIKRRCSASFRSQDILVEALHVYVSAMLVNDTALFVSLDRTSPNRRVESSVGLLYTLAKKHFSDGSRTSLDVILRTELNAITPEKLAVAYALIDLLFREKRNKWDEFTLLLEKHSYDNKTLKGPDGRHRALQVALKKGMGLTITELESKVETFVETSYLHLPQVADALGIRRRSTQATYRVFLKFCQRRMEGDAHAGEDNPMFERILGLLNEEIERRGRGF